MEFTHNKPIYQQIMDWIGDKIITGEWSEHGRISSVRELAGLLQVNPNTVMRSYESLQSEEIIYNKRGIGYFVSEGAAGRIRDMRRVSFLEHTLPGVFDRMRELDIPFEKLTELYEKHKTTGHENK